jgi:hypothetical protein
MNNLNKVFGIMNRIFFICMPCFKTNEPPEEMKSNKGSKIPDLSNDIIKDRSLDDNKDQTQLPVESKQLSPNCQYVRRKYMRIRSKTSQSNQLDMSISEYEISNRSQVNDNSLNH